MDTVKWFPNSGLKLDMGLSVGQNTPGARDVQKQIEFQNSEAKVDAPVAAGPMATLSRDLVHIPIANGLKLSVTPQVNLGFTNQNANYDTGRQQNYWTVDSTRNRTESYGYLDEYGDYTYGQSWETSTSQQAFNNYGDAAYYARTHRGAEYPVARSREIYNTGNHTQGIIAPGVAVGVIANLADLGVASPSSLRGDAVLAQNVLGDQTWLGGKFSVDTKAGRSTFGASAEVRRQVAGAGTGDMNVIVGGHWRL